MSKTTVATLPLFCHVGEFQEIMNFTYGHVLESSTNETNPAVNNTYKFLIWDKIEIQYNIEENLVTIYKTLASKNEGEAEKEQPNDTETMINLVIESIILCVLSMNEDDEEIDEDDRLDLKIDPIITLFKEQFGDSFSSMEGIPNNGLITLDRINAQVDFTKMKVVKCNSNPLRGRIESILSIGKDLKQPLC
ncbi:protein Syc1p [Monosporozyma unispora]|nr:endoribonuclease ysh1 [Kazachstania unispora]